MRKNGVPVLLFKVAPSEEGYVPCVYLKRVGDQVELLP